MPERHCADCTGRGPWEHGPVAEARADERAALASSRPEPLDVDRLARALYAENPQLYPDAWPNDEAWLIGRTQYEHAEALAREYDRLGDKG